MASPTKEKALSAAAAIVSQLEAENAPPSYWSLWMPKLVYFLYGAGNASFWGRFDSIWLGRHGFSAGQTALMFSFLPFFFMFASFWGALADKLQNHKLVLVVCMTLCSVTLQILNILDNSASQYVFGNFLVVSILLSAYWCFFSAQAILDTLVLDILGKHKDLFGQQRMYQSISMALFGFFAGVIQQSLHWNGFFYACAITQMSAVLLVIFSLPRTVSNAHLRHDPQSQPQSGGMMNYAKLMLGTPRTVVFLLIIVAFGIGMLIVDKFLSRFIEEVLEGSTVLIGLDGLVMVMSELPVLQASNMLIQRFGVPKLIIWAQIIYVIRILMYTLFTPNYKWFIIVMEPLHGISFGVFLVSSIYHLATIAPRGMEATSQGVFLGLFQGVGNGLGGVLCGILFAGGFHIRALFFFGALIMVGALVLYVSSIVLTKDDSPKKEQTSYLLEKNVESMEYGASRETSSA